MLPSMANVSPSSVAGIELRTPAPWFLKRLTLLPAMLGGLLVGGLLGYLGDFMAGLAAGRVSSRGCRWWKASRG